MSAYQEDALFGEILSLIALRQEGAYWDFKKEWHHNRADLLHDIICMANNPSDSDGYIIIGVDEDNDYSLVNVQENEHRKNTQQLVTFLRDKKFVAGIRPVAYVETIVWRGVELDVIVVKNSNNTPFYLTDSFESVRANHIYSRVMDTNTPKDKSADINIVEQLWRKRFHLDESPLDKVCFYLTEPDKWQSVRDFGMEYFYKYAPEYTISCETDDRDGYEYYIFGQLDTRPSWWMITLRYHQTVIESILGLALDGGRCFVSAPSRCTELLDVGIGMFGYYIEDNIRGRLLDFFHEKETADEYSYAQYLNAVVVFKTMYEYEGFIQYVTSRKSRFDELAALCDNNLPHFPDLTGYNMDHFKKEYRDALAANAMLSEYRRENWDAQAATMMLN